jgi:hypothetical protein
MGLRVGASFPSRSVRNSAPRYSFKKRASIASASAEIVAGSTKSPPCPPANNGHSAFREMGSAKVCAYASIPRRITSTSDHPRRAAISLSRRSNASGSLTCVLFIPADYSALQTGVKNASILAIHSLSFALFAPFVFKKTASPRGNRAQHIGPIHPIGPIGPVLPLQITSLLSPLAHRRLPCIVL